MASGDECAFEGEYFTAGFAAGVAATIAVAEWDADSCFVVSAADSKAAGAGVAVADLVLLSAASAGMVALAIADWGTVARRPNALLAVPRSLSAAAVAFDGFTAGRGVPVGHSSQPSPMSSTMATSAAKNFHRRRRTARSITALSSSVSSRSQASSGKGAGSGSGGLSRWKALSISLSDHIANGRSSVLGQHRPQVGSGLE